MPAVGSKLAPLQVAPPWNPGITNVLLVPGGVKATRPSYERNRDKASARASGEISVTSASERDWRQNGGGLVGKGCVAAACSPGTFEGGTGRSSIGKTGLPVSRSKRKTKPVL